MYRFMIGNDFHFPAQDDKAIDLWFQVMRYWKPDQIDLLGDISDGTEYSRHVAGGTTEFFNKHQHLVKDDNKEYNVDDVLEQVMLNEKPARDFILENRKVRKKAEIHVWDGNHECLDLETKAVTKRGALFVNEIREDDEVLSLDKNGEAVWQKVDEIIRQDYRGKMFSAEANGYSLKVTPNHRIIGFDKVKKEYIEYFAKDINALSAYRREKTDIESAARSVSKPDLDMSDDEIKVAAWALTDSHRFRDSWIFYQSGDKVERIKSLLSDLGFNYELKTRQRDTDEICGKKLKNPPQVSHELHVSQFGSKRIDSLVENKNELPSWTSDLSKRQAEVFLREYSFCDGTDATSGTAKAIYVCREKLRYGLRLLAIQNGFSASETEYRQGHWRINLAFRSSGQIKSEGFSEVDYDGEIWCLRVPNGQFFVERNGRIHLTGNSPRVTDYFDKYAPNVSPYINMEEIYGVDKIKGTYHWYTDEPSQRHGDLYLHHGNMTGTNAGDSVKKHVDTFGVSMVIGHCHRVAHINKTFNLRGEILRGYENGHMADVKHPLMGYTNSKNWQQGFIVGLVDDDGNAHVNQVTITKDYTCMVNGKIFKA